MEKKVEEMIAMQPFSIPNREGIWVNTELQIKMPQKDWYYCKRFEDKSKNIDVDFVYIPAGTIIETKFDDNERQ